MNTGVLQAPSFTVQYSDNSSVFLSLENNISWIARNINNSAWLSCLSCISRYC